MEEIAISQDDLHTKPAHTNLRNEKSVPILASSAAVAHKGFFEEAFTRKLSRRRTVRQSSTATNDRFSAETSSHLGEKLVGDVVIGCGMTLSVAPFLSLVDKAVVQRAAGTHTILSSGMETLSMMARNPIKFMKSPMFLMMWGVYASTYTTANTLKTLAEEHEKTAKRARPNEEYNANAPKWGIFLGTTSMNSATALVKDRIYAEMFGTKTVGTGMPALTYALWATRDCIVIGSSFILPDKVGPLVQQSFGLNHTDSVRVAQLLCPIFAQFLVGPIQLLGLDLYNRPMKQVSWGEMASARVKFLGANVSSVVCARIVRIFPGYSIGGVGNTYFRKKWKDAVESKDINAVRGISTLKEMKRRNSSCHV